MYSSVQAIQSIAIQTKLTELFGSLRVITQVICSNSQLVLVLGALFYSIDCFSVFAKIEVSFFWLLARQIFTLYKFQFSIQTFFIFFFIKRLRYQKDDSLVSYSAQFLSENPRVVEIIFYVNFLSSRKYDWNVAPKDLEKYGAPTAHASYFFLRK